MRSQEVGHSSLVVRFYSRVVDLLYVRVAGFQSRPELMVREDQFMNGTDKLLIEDHLEATVSTEESHASVIAGAGVERSHVGGKGKGSS